MLIKIVDLLPEVLEEMTVCRARRRRPFARTDFDETDPFVREIIVTGERIV
ncbi:MAG: hypothetical protein M0P74_14940 [Syntrophales bacterium]|jgi:hypothetical protein|nr:hypothetical protein [Syntrophales bacterium]